MVTIPKMGTVGINVSSKYNEMKMIQIPITFKILPCCPIVDATFTYRFHSLNVKLLWNRSIKLFIEN